MSFSQIIISVDVSVSVFVFLIIVPFFKFEVLVYGRFVLVCCSL
jgi:hypothetical protein